MKRKIINIDEERCNGCGECVPECHEGALQIIDGKARLISDLFCDGLGACIGHCPEGAMTIEEREAEPYDERIVMDTIVKGGANVIKAHLEHLRDHEEFEYVNIALDYLKEHGIPNPITAQANKPAEKHNHGGGCPGSQSRVIEKKEKIAEDGQRVSHLEQWPIQLHLVPPTAPYYRNADLLLAADCVGFSYPDFHKDYLDGKSLAIACPKLDTNQDIYREKLVAMINEANINSLTVMIMQVPCCGGLFQMAQQAIVESDRDIPLKAIVVGINGEILKEVDVN